MNNPLFSVLKLIPSSCGTLSRGTPSRGTLSLGKPSRSIVEPPSWIMESFVLFQDFSKNPNGGLMIERDGRKIFAPKKKKNRGTSVLFTV